jgi:hypothetical protein
VNKGATNKHLTRYLHERSDKIQLLHEYILRGLADKEALSILNKRNSSRVDWDLHCSLKEEQGRHEALFNTCPKGETSRAETRWASL